MSQKTRVLTGITTTGTPHLGNYVGAIRPAIAASRRDDVESFYFLADLHALIKCEDPQRIARSRLEIAATWLALGLDTDRAFFYAQSDIIETTELTWLLTCVTGKGLLNRAHAYKAAVDRNESELDGDSGITAGLFMYPVLMAADILIFNAQCVPVGRDQIQHIEMARDIAQRFNNLYGDAYRQVSGGDNDPFTLPVALIDDNVATLPGLDGRKMSKSYNNTIPLWLPREKLRKAIMGIVTDSRAPGAAKDTEGSNIFSIYQAFASDDETAAMQQAFADGIGWGDAKQKLFERIDAELAEPRERYAKLIANPDEIQSVLSAGARKARERSSKLLQDLRRTVGLGAIGSDIPSYLSVEEQTFREAFENVAPHDHSKPPLGDVIPMLVKGPWEEGGVVGLTVVYERTRSHETTLMAQDLSGKREAGLLKRKLESGFGFDIDVVTAANGFHEVVINEDGKTIARGIASQMKPDAYKEIDKLHHSIALLREANALAAKQKGKSA